MPSQSHNQGHDLSAGEQIQTEISSEYMFKVQLHFINSPFKKNILIIHIKKNNQIKFSKNLQQKYTSNQLNFLLNIWMMICVNLAIKVQLQHNIHKECTSNKRLCQTVHFSANLIKIGCKIKKL